MYIFFIFYPQVQPTIRCNDRHNIYRSLYYLSYKTKQHIFINTLFVATKLTCILTENNETRYSEY